MRLAATPIDGKANKALIEVLAQKLDVPKSCVRIRSGLSSRRKIVDVETAVSRGFETFCRSWRVRYICPLERKVEVRLPRSRRQGELSESGPGFSARLLR